MEKPKFVYVSYIKTTPEKLWKALTSPEFTARYWFGIRWETDWRVGSKCVAVMPDGNANISGEVLECDPPRRLAYSWIAHQKEYAGEAPSRAAFDIVVEGPLVKLTVTHDGFPEKSVVFGAISTGWPRVLSGLKTLLETGDTLGVIKNGCSSDGGKAVHDAAAAAAKA